MNGRRLATSWCGSKYPCRGRAWSPLPSTRGFTYHHADDRYVMMLGRLEDEAFVPNYSTHYIGAGGVVINAYNEILVVREKRGGVGSGSFKLPGGHLHEQEHLADAVVREVLEETGIESRFVSPRLLPPPARLPTRQVGHIFRVPVGAAEHPHLQAGR